MFDISHIFAQNIDRGCSNEYPQSMFWIKNKKNILTQTQILLYIKKWGLRGYSLHGHVFLMNVVMFPCSVIINIIEKASVMITCV